MVFWFPSEAVYRCSKERYFEKFHKIHSKTPTIEIELQVMSITLQNKRRHCRCFPIWMVISTSQRSLRFWNQHFVKNGLIRNFFWSAFSPIWTKYLRIWISPYSVGIQQNTDKKNSVSGHFSRCATLLLKTSDADRESSRVSTWTLNLTMKSPERHQWQLLMLAGIWVKGSQTH